MPLFMDAHRNLKGVSLDAIIADHMSDLEAEKKHGVRYLKFWFNESAQTVFCLADGPSAEACAAVHHEAHGNMAESIIEVDPAMLEAVLGGRKSDIGLALDPNGGLDTAFRTILFTDIQGSTALTQRRGDRGAMRLVRFHDAIVRAALGGRGGREVKHTGDGIMGCFVSASAGVDCAIAIQKGVANHNRSNPDDPIHVRIGLSAGEPVVENQDLFGQAVQLARRVCDHAGPDEILVANVVRELCAGGAVRFVDKGAVEFKGFAEPMRIHQVCWA